MNAEKPQFTALLKQLAVGDGKIVDQVLPLVYTEMHRIAERHLRGERAGHTLNATALIHEAYFKLVGQEKVNWQNKAHFLGIASIAMRRILINYAQARRAQKRGGDQAMVTFDEQVHNRSARADDLLALDEALNRLHQQSERQAKVIEYWFFGGLTHEEIAEILNVSLPTIRRDWRLARAWLSKELSGESKTLIHGDRE